MSTWHSSRTTSKPLARTRLVERSRLGVQLHVTGVDARPKHPRVVEVALAGLDEQNLEVVVKIRQPSSNDTTATSTTAHNDVELLWQDAEAVRVRVGSRHDEEAATLEAA